MRRRIIVVVGIAIFTVIGVVIIGRVSSVQSAQPTPYPFQPLRSTQLSATGSAASARLATGIAGSTLSPGAVTGPTLTAEAKPIPSCTSSIGTVSTPLPTISPNNPSAILLETAQAQNASALYIPSQTTDLAPQTSVDSKESVIVRDATCMITRYLVPYGQADAFIAGLPKSDMVILRSPARPYAGNKPTPATPSGGNSTPYIGVKPKPSSP